MIDLGLWNFFELFYSCCHKILSWQDRHSYFELKGLRVFSLKTRYFAKMLHFKFFLPRNGLVGVVDVTWTFFLDGFSAILDLNLEAIFAFSLSSLILSVYLLSLIT